jgi:hypothetical protein
LTVGKDRNRRKNTDSWYFFCPTLWKPTVLFIYFCYSKKFNLMVSDLQYKVSCWDSAFLPNLTKNPAIDANEFIHVAALFLMPVLVFAFILNMIYTILCVVCLTTTCCQNTHFRMAADPLNNDQRFLLLLVCKNVGYDVQTLLLQKLSTRITQKMKKRKSTEAGTDNLNFLTNSSRVQWIFLIMTKDFSCY